MSYAITLEYRYTSTHSLPRPYTEMIGKLQIPTESSPQKVPPVRSAFEALGDNHKGRTGYKEVLLQNYENRTMFVQTEG
jgi:hypothetical protein